MTPSLRSGVFRTDIGTLRPVERRDDGSIIVDAFLTRCGVFQYRQPDGTVRRELRLPEDVFHKDSIRSFEGVVVTNDHPPGMITAKNARRWSCGSVLGIPTKDSDHLRGRLSVTDHDTVQDMENGKVQVSCGYTCDTIETPGVHPIYGPYDAIQRNIRGNHVAIVDRGRAGITASARMDGWMVDDADGMTLASEISTCKSQAIVMSLPTARIELVLRTDEGIVDPNDIANRNARGANDAPAGTGASHALDAGGDAAKPFIPGQAPAKKPAAAPPKKTAPPKGPPQAAPEGDEEETPPAPGGDEAAPAAEGEAEGAETEQATDDGDELAAADDQAASGDDMDRRVAAASYAVPGRKGLPIHDPVAVKSSMRDFGGHTFGDANEKHAAYNRINGRAKQFGINTAGFEKAHAGKLDSVESPKKDTDMTPEQIKDLQQKADSRKEKLVAAKSRIDSLETEMATKDGEIASLKKDLESAKNTRNDAADQARVDAKIDLLDKARKAGATVESKMTDRAIKLAVVKHVDGDDVPADKQDAYVDALFDGALKRANKDAAATARGAQALAGTRQAIVINQSNADSVVDDTDEDAAKARLRSDSATQWARKETK